MAFSGAFYGPEILTLMSGALHRACPQSSTWLVLGQEEQSAMARQIMVAVDNGERDAERLSLEALSALHGQSIDA